MTSGSTTLFDLSGRTAVVTGAAPGGLGERIARTLADLGVRLVLVDLAMRQSELRTVAEQLPNVDGPHLTATCDVRSEAEVQAAIDYAAGQLGQLHLLIHAAGVMVRKPALEMSLEEWARVLDVNVTGTWLTNRAAARHMLLHGYGRIVNISSVYTHIVGQLPESGYYASKGGVAQLTRALAGEWSRDGVNVNCIAPGTFYPTAMTEPLGQQPEVLQRMEERTMLGRLGDPSRDLGGVAAFLCTSAADYMTGQVLFVDGGWSAR